MKTKTKMTAEVIPRGFTIPMTIVDAIPVLLFCLTAVLLGSVLSEGVFILGACLAFWAGATKVLWKLIVVLKKKNIWWMFLQMRYVMPIGFLLMLLGGGLAAKDGTLSVFLGVAKHFPQLGCFLLGFFGMVLMIILGLKLDSSDAKANWIEQTVNSVAQGAFFVGMLLCMITMP